MALPQGGLIICDTGTGRFVEINENKDVVWKYRNPLTSSGLATQFDNIDGLNNQAFRAEKYPSNFAGFIGKDLTPIGTIENENSLSEECLLALPEETNSSTIKIINPAVNDQVEFTESIQAKTIQLLNLSGEIIFQWNNVEGKILNFSNLSKGVYIVRIPEMQFQERIIIL